jgi:transcriptional regulator with XRE-family HTH domain
MKMNDTVPMDSIREADAARVSKFVAMIRSEREGQEMTVERLAKRAGIDAAALYDLEAGQVLNPNIGTLFRIADALGKNLVLGFEGDDSPAPARTNDSRRLKTALIVVLAIIVSFVLIGVLASELDDELGEDGAIVVLTIGLSVAIVVALILNERRQRRCELCGKWAALKKTGKQLIKQEKSFRISDWEERVPIIRSTYQNSYRCARCDRETHKRFVREKDAVASELHGDD